MPLSMRKIWGSIPRPVKSDTVLPTARHRCEVSSDLCCPGAKMRGRTPPLATMLRYCSEFNETSTGTVKICFDLLKKLGAAIATAQTPYLRKLLLTNCFTAAASMTKMQFKQSTLEKLDYRYCCISHRNEGFARLN